MFGNLILDLGEDQLPASGLRLGRGVSVGAGGAERAAVVARTFADVADGDLLLYLDSSGTAALAVNRASAADALGAAAGDEVTLSPA